MRLPTDEYLPLQSVYRWESNIGITETPTPYGGIPSPTP